MSAKAVYMYIYILYLRTIVRRQFVFVDIIHQPRLLGWQRRDVWTALVGKAPPEKITPPSLRDAGVPLRERKKTPPWHPVDDISSEVLFDITSYYYGGP